MAFVQLPDGTLTEVPDDWNEDQVNAAIPSLLELGPKRFAGNVAGSTLPLGIQAFALSQTPTALPYLAESALRAASGQLPENPIDALNRYFEGTERTPLYRQATGQEPGPSWIPSQGDAEFFRYARPENPSLPFRAIEFLADAMSGTAPSLAALPFGLAGAAMASAPILADEYQKARDKGVTPVMSMLQAGPSAAVELATSFLGPVGRFLKGGRAGMKETARSFSRDIPASVALEGVEESISGGFADTLAAQISDPERGFKADPAEFIKRRAHEFALGAVGAAPVAIAARQARLDQLDDSAVKLALNEAGITAEGQVSIVDRPDWALSDGTIIEGSYLGKGQVLEGNAGDLNTLQGQIIINLPAIRGYGHLVKVLQEERAHKMLGTEAGLEAMARFTASNPLSERQVRKLQAQRYTQLPNETDDVYRARLVDESIAKANRASWFRRAADRFAEVIAPVIGVQLPRNTAARLLLRNLEKVPMQPLQTIERGGEVVEERQGQEEMLAGLATPMRFSLSKAKPDRLVRSFANLVKQTRGASSWRDWYDRFQGQLQNFFGDDAPMFRQFLAATSQRTSVKANVTFAVKAYAQWVRGEPFSGQATEGALANLNRAARGEAVRGQKVSQFDSAMDKDPDAIAVDQHVGEILFGETGKKPSAAQVAKGKQVIRRIANEIQWTPQQAQAALWAANQIRQGKEPGSFDTYLEAKRSEIASIRRERLEAQRGDPFEQTARGQGVAGTGDIARSSIARTPSKPVTDAWLSQFATKDGYSWTVDVDKLRDLAEQREFVPSSPINTALLSYLLNRSSLHPLRRIGLTTSIERRYGGRYVQDEGKKEATVEVVMVRGNGEPISEDLFLRILNHELVHNAFTSKIEAAPIELRRRLNRLFEFAKENAPEELRSHNAFKNRDEFVAEAFSSPRFRKFLYALDYSSQIPIDNRYRGAVPDIQVRSVRESVFGYFLQLVRRVIKLPETIRDWASNEIDTISALDEVVNLSMDLENIERGVVGYLEALQPSLPTARASIGRKPWSAEGASRVEAEMRKAFPSMPSVVWVDAPSDDPPATFKDGKIQAYAPGLNSAPEARAHLLAAIHQAGAEIAPEAFWSGLYDTWARAEPAQALTMAQRDGGQVTPESKRRAVADMIRARSLGSRGLSGLWRRVVDVWSRMIPGVVDDQTALALGLDEAIATLSSQFRTKTADPMPATSQKAIFAIQHRAVWQHLREPIQRLRAEVSALDELAYDKTQLGTLRRKMEKIRDKARARREVQRGEGTFDVPIESIEFLDRAVGEGVEITQEDSNDNNLWLQELNAQGVARLLDAQEEAIRIRDSLAANLPAFDLTNLNSQIARNAARLDMVEEMSMERAEYLRQIRDQQPEARSARKALANPFIVSWMETIDRMEQATGEPPVMTPDIEANAQVHDNHFLVDFAAFQRSLEKEDAAKNRLLGRLRELRRDLSERRKKQGTLDAQIHDILSFLKNQLTKGKRGLDRDELLATSDASVASRDLPEAIVQFAKNLAQAAPDSEVGQVRDSILAGIVPRGTILGRDAFGVSEEVTNTILSALNESEEFRIAVVDIYDLFNPEVQQHVLTTVEGIEAAVQAGDMDTARRLASGAVRRRRRDARDTRIDSLNLERQIADVAEEVETRAMLDEIASINMPELSGVRAMVYRTQRTNNIQFEGFDIPGGKQEPIVLTSSEPFTKDTVRKLVQWIDNAALARDARTTDERTRRGLEVGAEEAWLYVDANATQEEIGNTLAPGYMSKLLSKTPAVIRSGLSRLLPGASASRLARAGFVMTAIKSRIDALRFRNLPTRQKLEERAAKSLRKPTSPGNSKGLNLASQSGLEQFWLAMNETMHRLRAFGSGVAVGDVLVRRDIRGMTVTRELLDLLKHDRDIFREAQAISGDRAYGGIREVIQGREGPEYVVRAPAPTGDIGFARVVDSAPVKKLATLWRLDPRADAPGILKHWNDDMDGVLSHVMDAGRLDLGNIRDPAMAKAEQELTSDIRRNIAGVPESVDEVIGALATRMPTVSVEIVRQRFLNELADYAKSAVSRTEAESKTFQTSAGEVRVVDADNEYTQPAARLRFPSSWYHYGASEGMERALDRVMEPATKDYVSESMAAEETLNVRKQVIKDAIRAQKSLEPFAAEIRWHTAGGVHKGQGISDKRAEDAINNMVSTANRLAEIRQLAEIGFQKPWWITRQVRRLLPFLLSLPKTMILNIVGGPVAMVIQLGPMLGWPRAFAIGTMALGVSPASASFDAVVSLLPQSVRTQIKSHGDLVEFLASIGTGFSYSRYDLEELRSFLKDYRPSFAGQMVDAVGRVISEQVSPRTGVKAGDTVLNRFFSRFVIPHVLLNFQGIARRWQNRVGHLPRTPDFYADAANIVNAEDVGDARRAQAIRERISEANLNPERVMEVLADPNFDRKRFWRTNDGRKLGELLLDNFNVATTLNRPLPNSLLVLLGWTAAQASAIADGARTLGDASRRQKVTRAAIHAFSIALAGTVFGLAQGAAKQSFGLAWNSLLEALTEPPDEDDEEGTLAWLIERLHQAATSTGGRIPPWRPEFWDRPASEITGDFAGQGPWQEGYWNRDWGTVAWDLMTEMAGGYGMTGVFSPDGSLRTPYISIGSQGFQGGTGVGKAAIDLLDGNKERAERNMTEGLRKASSLFGGWGRFIFNLWKPEYETTKAPENAIRNALLGFGIAPSQSPILSSISTATPVRRPLLGAGMEWDQARTPEEREEATERIRQIAQDTFNRAQDRALRNGDSEEEAATKGEQAVKSLISPLNPYERVAGRALNQEQFDQVQASIAKQPESVRAEIAAQERGAEAVASVLASNPPEGMRSFRITPSMLSPVKQRRGLGSIKRITGASGIRLPQSTFRRRGSRRSNLSIRRSTSRRLRVPKIRRFRAPRIRRRSIRSVA